MFVRTFGGVVSSCLFVGGILFSGCGGLVGNPHPPKEAGSGTSYIQLELADAPVDRFDRFHLSIESIEISQDQENWTPLQLSLDSSVNILELTGGHTVPLAFHPEVAKGSYQFIKVTIDTHGTEAWQGDQKVAMSWDTSEITIPIDFDLMYRSHKWVLDLDLRQSLARSSSGYGESVKFSPVVRAVDRYNMGELRGVDIEYTRVVCVYPQGVPEDPEDSCNNSVGSALVKDGSYTVPFLPPGDYYVVAYGENAEVETIESSAVVEAESVDLAGVSHSVQSSEPTEPLLTKPVFDLTDDGQEKKKKKKRLKGKKNKKKFKKNKDRKSKKLKKDRKKKHRKKHKKDRKRKRHDKHGENPDASDTRQSEDDSEDFQKSNNGEDED